MGRASAEDLAIAITEEFSGARGLAKIAFKLLTAEGTGAATKARILANIQSLLSNTSKLYGDRAKLAGMNKEQLEIRIWELVKKHGGIVPLQGIRLDVRQDAQPIQDAEDGKEEAVQ